MANDINPLNSIVTLITSNYQISNTDNITPTVAKIYTKPTDKTPRPNQDFILVYSELTSHTSVGIGANNRAEVNEALKIDIRVKPNNTSQSLKTDDTHARKVLAEVKRILYSNIVNPDSNFDYIDPENISITDLSNGSRGIFRYILKINLVALCRDMTI